MLTMTKVLEKRENGKAEHNNKASIKEKDRAVRAFMYSCSRLPTEVMSFFNGKVVIVTGSSGGIGRETARRFAENGAKVTITGRNMKALQETVKSCICSGAKEGDIHIVTGDIRSKDVQETIVIETIEKFGKLDVLVNNAGGLVPNKEGKRGLDVPVDELRAVMDLNLDSVLGLSQLATPHLEKSKGAIVNISSIAAFPLVSDDFYYNISKSAVDQLTAQMAGNLIKKGIRVNGVNPGAIETDFVSRHMGEEAKQKMQSIWESTERIPIGRMGRVDDIAKAILFLADRSQSEFIVGHRLVIDGGSVLKNNIMSSF